MPPRPGQKRSAPSRSEPSSSKKTRFVEPSEDPASFAEQVDGALEGPTARGRRVKTEGYDSDSSDEGGDRRRAAAAAAAAAVDDEEDDMFAIEEKKDSGPAAADGGKKKEESYLRLGDIEGQEFNERPEDGEEDDESEEEDEPEDEDDAIRRSKAGMGYELSSFNMREEMEEGKFTEDGAYVRTKDEHAAHDKWMDGLDEKEIKQARRRKRQREKAERERQKAEERELEDAGGKEQLERDLLSMLKKGETVLEALQRLGAQAKKSQKQDKQKAKSKAADPSNMEVDKSPKASKTTTSDKSTKAFSPIEHVTHLASMLLSLGDSEIYGRTYEELVRSVRSSGKVPADWDPPSADVRYEYMWDVPDSTAPGQVFGPYGEEEMKAWDAAAYFGPGAEKVKVRTVGGEWGKWKDVVL